MGIGGWRGGGDHIYIDILKAKKFQTIANLGCKNDSLTHGRTQKNKKRESPTSGKQSKSKSQKAPIRSEAWRMRSVRGTRKVYTKRWLFSFHK